MGTGKEYMYRFQKFLYLGLILQFFISGGANAMAQQTAAQDKVIHVDCAVEGMKAARICTWLAAGLTEHTEAQVVQGDLTLTPDLTVRLWSVRTTGFKISVTSAEHDHPDIGMDIVDTRLDQPKVVRFMGQLVKRMDAFSDYAR